MEEGGVVTLAKPILPRPKLVVQPRNSKEGFIQGGLNSATPTPMIFGSSLCGDCNPYTDSRPISSLLVEALGSPIFSPMDFVNNVVNKMTVTDTQTGSGDGKPAQTESSEMWGAPVDSQSIRGAKYRAMMPSRLPIASSSQLTISPGISPAALLESPIFFSKSQTDPSPTTGSFPLPLYAHGMNNASTGEDCTKSPERKDSFMFKPHPLVEEKYGSPANMGMSTFGIHAEETAKHSDGQWQPHVESKDLYSMEVHASDSTVRQASSFSSSVLEPQDHFESVSMASAAVVPRHVRSTSCVSGETHQSNGRLSIDGYNWKKYGQKTLKNSENPRSYYKCTHPNCPAKTQVECSQEGVATAIIYKGNHNHEKPQGTRKRAKSGSLVVQNSMGAHHDCVVRDSIAVSNMNRDKASGDVSSSFVYSHGGLPGTPELSFTSPCNEDDENGEASMGGYDGKDEHQSKHRRIESEEENFSRECLRTNREPRVVIKTASEKVVLDDGYRWRKYGQKVVKGHQYPRNYYKCTNIGCKVRKHVERSSSDSKFVMTTYEGKHNHSVPPARGSMRETEEVAMAPAALYPASPAHRYSEGTHSL